MKAGGISKEKTAVEQKIVLESGAGEIFHAYL